MSIIYFIHKPDLSKIAGYFDEDDGHTYVNSNQSKIDQEITIAHESQHKKCFESKCKCWKYNDYWSEYHAFRAELDYVIKQNRVRLWKAYFQFVMKQKRKYQRLHKKYPQHLKALQKVCILKRFKYYRSLYGD